jgi:two-component system, NtrC family, response regulator GlrR
MTMGKHLGFAYPRRFGSCRSANGTSHGRRLLEGRPLAHSERTASSPLKSARESITNASRDQLSLIGQSDVFQTTVALIERLAGCDATTLIDGETGTGKEVAARAIHYLSARRDFPFIPIHCGALPDSLLEAELFGHEKGAFTDAKERRAGLVTEAAGGTLFFDEVEAMTPRAQVVLLRFLQDQSYRAVGGRSLHKADVRIIAASNALLPDLIERGSFRQDLWFRLKVLELALPPLRERRGDPVLLARHFLSRFTKSYDKPGKRLHEDTISWLDRYDWPGNVRELESLMLREFLLHDGDEVRLGSAPRGTSRPPSPAAHVEVPRFEPIFKSAKALALADFEQKYLRQLLATTHGNISRAARLAHKDRSALNKLVRKHGLVSGDFQNAGAARGTASRKRPAGD